MWKVKTSSIKPTNIILVENNEYMVIMQYKEYEEIRNKTIEHIKTEQRFSKATKKGNITINLFGNKYKYNIKDIKEGW